MAVLIRAIAPVLMYMAAMASGDPTSPPSREGQQDGYFKLPPVLTKVNTPGKLAFLQDVFRNGGPDPLSLITSIVQSPALQKIYDNVEIQHRILEANPLLGAIQGFKQAMGRNLDSKQTAEAFKRGVQTLLELGKSSETTIKDPTASIKVLNDLLSSGDNAVKELVVAAKGGDEEAIKELKRLVSQRLFPGVDLDRLDELHTSANFDRILNIPEMMYYIDQDPYMSEAFRRGVPLPSAKKATAGEGLR